MQDALERLYRCAVLAWLGLNTLPPDADPKARIRIMGDKDYSEALFEVRKFQSRVLDDDVREFSAKFLVMAVNIGDQRSAADRPQIDRLGDALQGLTTQIGNRLRALY